MEDDVYLLKTAVRESENTARFLEEKIRQLIDIIDNRNQTIVSISSAISLHKKQFDSIEADCQTETINEINNLLWGSVEDLLA